MMGGHVVSGFKRIRDMADELSNESEKRLRELLTHWRGMARSSALIRHKKHQREYEQKARQVERALKLKQTRTDSAPPG
jgi:hypothetical protein